MQQHSSPADSRTATSRFYQMDLVRYYLALSVIVAHFNIVFGYDVGWPTSSGSAVGIFFGFSGFLVYASYLHHADLKGYVMSRAKRILPAYSFVVIACALLLSLLSTLSLRDYFLNAAFWKYLAANLTFLNFLQPELPGVFGDNHLSAVNGSLWTLKVEWMLYLSIPLFFYVLRRTKAKPLVVVLLLFLLSLVYNNTLEYYSILTGNETYYKLSYQFAGQFVYFYTGVLFYIYKDHFLTHKLLYFSIGVLLLLADRAMVSTSEAMVVLWFHEIVYPIASVTVFLVVSVSKFLSPKVTILGNCSYEMYLFHFPILQTLAWSAAFTSLPIPVMLATSIVLTFVLAFVVNRLSLLLTRKKA